MIKSTLSNLAIDYVLVELSIIPAGVPLLVEVDHLIDLRGEKIVELLILENLIEGPHLIDGGLSSLISDSCQGGVKG